MEIEQVIRPEEFLPRVPDTIKRPCDYGLERAICDLETQLGTIEAYNRICASAAAFRKKIDDGESKEQLAMFRTDPGFAKG